MGDLNVNVEGVEPAGSREPIPDGEYRFAVVEATAKKTKAGTGQYLALKLEVLQGPYKGRFVWKNINFKNPNQECERIGLAELSALLKCFGMTKIDDSAEVLNKPFWAKVGRENRQDGSVGNKITSFLWKKTAPDGGGVETTAFPGEGVKESRTSLEDDDIPW